MADSGVSVGVGFLPLSPLLLFWLTCTLAAPSNPDVEKVRVTVYYEAMCPDSRRFILRQLYPTWRDLGDIMQLDLHSYGKTWERVRGEFHCQHGDRECEANMMLTCAKSHTDDQCIFVDFTRCVMQRFVGAKGGLLCANETGVEYSEVEQCLISSEGASLQHEVGNCQDALDPSLDYVPWILINDVFTREQLDRVQLDLKSVVCDAYQGERPAVCP